MTILTWIQLSLVGVGFLLMLVALLAHLRKASACNPSFEGKEDESTNPNLDGKPTGDVLASWSPVSH